MPDATQPLHDLLQRRWSPRNYAPRPVPDEALRSLFEAARWTASCFNEQPWAFVVATQAQPADFARVLECLVPKNQEWAKETVQELHSGQEWVRANSYWRFEGPKLQKRVLDLEMELETLRSQTLWKD